MFRAKDWKTNNKKTIIATCVVAIIGAITLIYTSRLVQAEIDISENEPFMVEFHGDHEAILACLNSKEWDVAVEWTVEDLTSILACVDGMWQIVGDDDLDVVDELDENDQGAIADDSEEEMYDDSEEEMYDGSEEEMYDDSEEEVYLEIGFMGMIPFEDLNWDAFRDGDASDLVFVEIIQHNWESMFHFQPSDPEIARLLNWFYEHQDAFTSEEPVYFEFPEEMTDEEFNRLIDEEGIIWMPRQIRIGTKVDACPYEQEYAPWTEGIGYYCETIFFMDDDLFERLDEFAWTLIR